MSIRTTDLLPDVFFEAQAERQNRRRSPSRTRYKSEFSGWSARFLISELKDARANDTGFARRGNQFNYRVNAKLTDDEERAEDARYGTGM